MIRGMGVLGLARLLHFCNKLRDDIFWKVNLSLPKRFLICQLDGSVSWRGGRENLQANRRLGNVRLFEFLKRENKLKQLKMLFPINTSAADFHGFQPG